MKKHFPLFFVTILPLLFLSILVNKSSASTNITSTSGIITFSESEFEEDDNINVGHAITSLNNYPLSEPITFKSMGANANASILTNSLTYNGARGNGLAGNIVGGGLDIWLDFNSEISTISFDYQMKCPNVGTSLDNGLLIAALTDTGPTWYNDWYLDSTRYSSNGANSIYGGSVTWTPGKYTSSGQPGNGEGMNSIHFWFDSDNHGCSSYFLDNINFTKASAGTPPCPEVGEIMLHSLAPVNGYALFNAYMIFNRGSTYTTPDSFYNENGFVYGPSLSDSSVCLGMQRVHIQMGCSVTGIYPFNTSGNSVIAPNNLTFSANTSEINPITATPNYNQFTLGGTLLDGWAIDSSNHPHCNGLHHHTFIPIVVK